LKKESFVNEMKKNIKKESFVNEKKKLVKIYIFSYYYIY
jgi:hypothetical protein